MKDIYESFETLCRKTFRFLETQFNCKVIRVEREPVNVGCHVVYQNSTTAVEVGFEPRENLITVLLARLISGKPAEYPIIIRDDTPINVFYLDELIARRVPKILTGRHRKSQKDLLNPEQLKSVLREYAQALRRYAADVLQGDFMIFSLLEEDVKQRVKRSGTKGTRY